MKKAFYIGIFVAAVLAVGVNAAVSRYPRFEFFSMDGSLYSSLKLRGRAVLISFFARQCLPCRMEVPFLNELHTKYPDTLTILGIAFMENDFNRLKGLMGDWGIKYAVIPDGNGNVAGAFNNEVFPSCFLMDHTGKVIGVYRGLANVNNKAIMQQLAALQPKISEYRNKGPAFFVGPLSESGQNSTDMAKIWQKRLISWLSAEGANVGSQIEGADYLISGNITGSADSTKIEIIFKNIGDIEEIRFSETLKKGEENKLRQIFTEKLKEIPYAIRRH